MQEGDGFPLLVRLLDTGAGRHATVAPAVAALTQLARNNARNRRAALCMAFPALRLTHTSAESSGQGTLAATAKGLCEGHTPSALHSKRVQGISATHSAAAVNISLPQSGGRATVVNSAHMTYSGGSARRKDAYSHPHLL